MARSELPKSLGKPAAYSLDEQVGFLLRQAVQRHVGIFESQMPEGMTPTQWAALARLYQVGSSSQNKLGRVVAMDVATIKGVVDRLHQRGLVATAPDPADARRRVVRLSDAGRELVACYIAVATAISEETLAPLTATEQRTLLRLLSKLR